MIVATLFMYLFIIVLLVTIGGAIKSILKNNHKHHNIIANLRNDDNEEYSV